ncbi:MAG: orotidine-5'-phosphate decarboxylase [Sphaerochaetaceae bacterium]|nr:orotidine-5'-phosphate decarboxylase [Sphaerochaetaceae bacterium]
MSYIEILIESAESCGNVTCMGLDPQLGVLPGEGDTRTKLNAYFDELFHRMRLEGVTPAAFKPNIGYYSALDNPRDEDFSGSLALVDLLEMLESFFPGIPVILDSKRGDIARSSLNYAIEAFDKWQSDAVTVSPYMGTDSVSPFGYEDKGVYILNRTSNPGGKIIQNIITKSEDGEEPLYLAVSKTIAAWAAEHKGFGAVVGATNMAELKDIAAFYAKCGQSIPLLIPGVGSQGGSAPEVMEAMRSVGYDVRLARINSSSGLTHPWKKAPIPEDWLEMCLSNLKKLNDETRI